MHRERAGSKRLPLPTSVRDHPGGRETSADRWFMRVFASVRNLVRGDALRVHRVAVAALLAVGAPIIVKFVVARACLREFVFKVRNPHANGNSGTLFRSMAQPKRR